MSPGLGECFVPVSVLVRKQHSPVVEFSQLLRRKLAAVFDRLAELVDDPDTVAVVGLVVG